MEKKKVKDTEEMRRGSAESREVRGKEDEEGR